VEEVQTKLANAYDSYSKLFNSYDWALLLKAMMNHDITKNFNGSLEVAAQAVKAKLLIITSSNDLMVNPLPALQFAEMTDATPIYSRMIADISLRAVRWKNLKK